MIFKFWLAASFSMVLAGACGGGEVTTVNAPNAPPSDDKSTAISSSAPERTSGIQSTSTLNITPADESTNAEAKAHLEAGLALQKEGKQREAIAEFDEAIRLDTQYALAYLNRGDAYRNLGQIERAIQDYDETIRVHPRPVAAYVHRGSAYGELRQYERAIQEYDEAIRLNPKSAPAYYNRGNTYGKIAK